MIGELLLAIALLVARSTPRWIPLLLIAHVATVALGSFLPEDLESMSALLLTVGLSGIGMRTGLPAGGPPGQLGGSTAPVDPLSEGHLQALSRDTTDGGKITRMARAARYPVDLLQQQSGSPARPSPRWVGRRW